MTVDGTVLRRAPDALVRESGPRVVVLPRAARLPIVLEGGAAVVWHALAEPATAGDVAVQVAALVGSDVPAGEVAACVDLLTAAGVVVAG